MNFFDKFVNNIHVNKCGLGDHSDHTDKQSYVLDESSEYFVDLQLPSHTLWCRYNLGATTETEFGNYYRWGETDVYNSAIPYPYYTKNSDLEKSEDAAFIYDNIYELPSKEQFIELRDNTTQEYIESYLNTEISGYLFTSKLNNNTLFIPMTGYKIVGHDSTSGPTYLHSKNKSNSNSGMSSGLYLYENTLGMSIYSIPGENACAIRPVKAQ